MVVSRPASLPAARTDTHFSERRTRSQIFTAHYESDRAVDTIKLDALDWLSAPQGRRPEQRRVLVQAGGQARVPGGARCGVARHRDSFDQSRLAAQSCA